MNQPRRAFLGTTAAVLGLFPASSLFAQQTPKQRGGRGYGQGFWNNKKSSQHTRHARNFAGNFYQYSTSTPQVDPSFAQSQSSEIQKNLETARKDLDTTRKQVAGDQEIQKRLTAIDAHLKKAVEHHHRLHTECGKNVVDAPAAMECCHDLIEELDRAIIEQNAVERLLMKPGTEDIGKSKASRP